MLITIAYGLAIVLSLAIVAIGVRFLIAPRVAAAGYGSWHRTVASEIV